MKDYKVYVVTLIIVVAFVVGLKLGENHVIRHQEITQTDSGYSVNFDGVIYEYD